MRLDASNACVDSDMGLTSPIPPSLTGKARRSRSAEEQASRPVSGRDEMLVDGCLQGTKQVLNTWYSPGVVGPMTGKSIGESSISCMRLGNGYC